MSLLQETSRDSTVAALREFLAPAGSPLEAHTAAEKLNQLSPSTLAKLVEAVISDPARQTAVKSGLAEPLRKDDALRELASEVINGLDNPDIRIEIAALIAKDGKTPDAIRKLLEEGLAESGLSIKALPSLDDAERQREQLRQLAQRSQDSPDNFLSRVGLTLLARSVTTALANAMKEPPKDELREQEKRETDQKITDTRTALQRIAGQVDEAKRELAEAKSDPKRTTEALGLSLIQSDREWRETTAAEQLAALRAKSNSLKS